MEIGRVADYQVTAADFEAFREALKGRPGVDFHLKPGLDHVFQRGEGPGLPAEYLSPGHVADQVIGDVVGWIKARKASEVPGRG